MIDTVELSFFTNTVAELDRKVVEKLRRFSISENDEILTACRRSHVQLNHHENLISLSGNWTMLLEARTKILQILGDIESSRNSTEMTPINQTTQMIGTDCISLQPHQSVDERNLASGDASMKRTRAFTCTLCPQSFKTKAELVKHVRFHDQKSSSKPTQPVGEVRARPELSTTDIKVLNDSAGNLWYECRVCSIVGRHKARMATHYKMNHSESTNVPLTVNPKPTVIVDIIIPNERDMETPDVGIDTQTLKSTKEAGSDISQVMDKNYIDNDPVSQDRLKAPNVNDLFICDVCNQAFTTMYYLKSHRRQHIDKPARKTNQVSQQKHDCDLCGKSFKRKVDLVHHKKLGKSCSGREPDPNVYIPPFVNGKYVCEVCSYSGLQRVHVTQHHARKHGPKEFKCNQCEKSFAYEGDLKKHKEIIHSSEKSFQCSQCGKKFACAKYLATHKLRHEKVKKHFCPTCGKGFLEKYRMQQHMETHTDISKRKKNYPCTICGKTFQSNAYRKDHENIHKGEEPYPCKFCGKTLKARCHMWKHVQLHHREKKLECPECRKVFRFKAALDAHMVTHTRLGKHSCGQCGKVYTQRQTLLRHICKSDTITPAVESLTKDIPPQNDSPYASTNNVVTEVVDTEQAASVQQNAYMCSECSLMFYDWDEINQHMLLHQPSVPGASMEENPQHVFNASQEGDRYIVQIIDTPQKSVKQPEENGETNMAVVNIVNPDIPHVVDSTRTNQVLPSEFPGVIFNQLD